MINSIKQNIASEPEKSENDYFYGRNEGKQLKTLKI